MKEYTILYRRGGTNTQDLPTLSIDQLLWSHPVPIKACAQLCYDEESLYVSLRATEPHIRAEETGPLGSPCEDSCLEFFFSPDPEEKRYFNVEFNANGCMFLGVGSSIRDLVRLLPLEPVIVPEITRSEAGWCVSYSIPWSFVRQFFPDFSPTSGGYVRANCYKCGDLTIQPHYLAWSPIDLQEPAFHCPEFFGKMYFE